MQMWFNDSGMILCEFRWLLYFLTAVNDEEHKISGAKNAILYVYFVH